MYDNDRVAPSVFRAPNPISNVGNYNVQGPPSTGIRIDNINDVPTVILPRRFSECSRTDLVILISRMLTFLIQMNDSSSTSVLDSVTNLTKFHSKVPPGISVYNYLMRLTKYSSLDHCVLMTAVYYIDLVSSVYPTFTLNSLTVHRFLLAATTVASKGLCDSFCTNTHYAKVGGVHCSELNVLECELLRRINYRIIPRDDNIAWCNLEAQYRHFVIDTQDGDDWTSVLSNLSGNRNNSGYNVLDIYYNKIVQLVGSLKSTQDKSKLVNYTFANTPKPTNIHNNGSLNSNSSSSGDNDKVTTTCNDDINNKKSSDSGSNFNFVSNSQIELEQRHTISRKRNLDTDIDEGRNESYGNDITGCENTLYNSDCGPSGNLNKRYFNRQKGSK